MIMRLRTRTEWSIAYAGLVGTKWGNRLAIAAMTLAASAAQAAWAQSPGPAEGTEDYHPHGGMLRYADVSATHIVFVYANDLWLVPREGGTASPLASPQGLEQFPRFSPDGKSIAFTGNYDGDRDIYTIPVDGGPAQRVTHHPDAETVYDWSPTGEIIFYGSGQAGLPRMLQLFTVAPEGGLPSRLPVPYGANGTISPDGKWLAYTPHTHDPRTWKRYRGGMATDIWLFHLQNHTSRKITDWEGTDSQPMWQGKTVYYLSDDGSHPRLNIWSFDTVSGKREQITTFSAYDVKWPAIGPGPNGLGEIVFQHGPDLMLLDLSTRQARRVEVIIPGDRPTVRQRMVEFKDFVDNAEISPSGKRVLVEARGDIWSVPAKNGSPRRLTRTSNAAERDPSWSPDGKWFTWFSDATGEYELYLSSADAKGEPRKLTNGEGAYYYNPKWSPDSKLLAFHDKTGTLFLHEIEKGVNRRVDVDPLAAPRPISWSSDSGWIAYPKAGENLQPAIWLYNVAKDEKHQVTSGMFNDTWPTFDRKGEYLAFASNREFSGPIYEDVGTTFVYAETDRLYLVPLRAKVGSPWAPRSDEEESKDEKKDDGDKKDEDKPAEEKKDDRPKDASDGTGDARNVALPGSSTEEPSSGDKGAKPMSDADKKSGGNADKPDAAKSDEAKPLEIELDGFERRAILVPVDRGGFSNLVFNHKNELIYMRNPLRRSEKNVVQILDLKDEERKENVVVEDVNSVQISADGKKLLVGKPKTLAVIDAAKDQKLKDRVPLDDMKSTVHPREEWRQMFREAWRVQRDFFYVANMHGVNWPGVYDQYAAMLDDCASREDLDYVLGEMIAELNVGHAYVRGGGDYEKAPEVPVGLPGCDFELVDGAYRISRIVEGGPWDADGRGPLSAPGVDVKVGDYLLAVNGVPVDIARDPWAAFLGLAGKTVSLTVSSKPELDDDARTVVVELLRSEGALRYRAWIERNRAYVAEKSDGRIGYIYVPNTGVDGQNDLFRQFYGQRDRQALIIDERWNGGGQIPTRFVELLDRPLVNYWARRDGRDGFWPPDAHHGPKCMLINGLAGSGGDYFPFYFRHRGVGKLIGTRTWGGLVGISGNPTLIDGGRVTAPRFGFYELDGTWGIEGHGVDPDIEVIDDPAKMVGGGDPQLDAAIEHLLEELKRKPPVQMERPADPDRSGMGLPETDR